MFIMDKLKWVMLVFFLIMVSLTIFYSAKENKITGDVVLLSNPIGNGEAGFFVVFFISLLAAAIISYYYAIKKFGPA